MITFTSQAQKLRDDYLRTIRDHFRGSKVVDGEEVARDITEHIERELESAPQPISEADMAKVIDQLGDPRQWGGDSEQTPSMPPTATEEQFTKRFSASPGGTLVVDVDLGSIVVTGSDTNEVVVDVWRKVGGKGVAHKHMFGHGHKFHFPNKFPFNFAQKGDAMTMDIGPMAFSVNTAGGKVDFSMRDRGDGKNAEEAQEFFQNHPVSIAQDGDVVTVEAEQSGGSGPKEAKYTISVPAQFKVKLETAGGGISVSDLVGSVKAETTGGELKFTRVLGALKGETSGGDVYVADCTGAIKLETSGSPIEVTGGSGSLKCETSGGPVTVKDFKGSADIETSGSDITIENVAGEISAETSGGGVSVILPALAGSLNIETSGGGISLRVPADAAFDLDAETSGGGVKCDLPVTAVGSMGRDHVRGTVNGGGTPVRLETSGGSIHIKKLQLR